MISGNYYEILEVDQTASSTDIRRAYTRKIRQYSNETHPEEFQIISKAYKTLGNEESRREYDHSIQDNGRYQEQLNELEDYVEKEYYDLVINRAESLLMEYPNDPAILYFQAIGYENLERYPEAERILKRLVLEFPDNEAYTSSLAFVYMEIKDYEKALKYLEKLIAINSLENNYYLRLSNCYLQLQQHSKAADVLENKLRLQETIYDFPLLTELYYLTVIMERDDYHQKVVSRIKALPKNDEERNKLLNLMIDHAASMEIDHYMVKEIITIIDQININHDPDYSNWVRESRAKLDPSRFYYGDPEQSNSSYQPDMAVQTQTAATVAQAERGSVLVSIILGIILSFIATPIVGIIAGFVYYFFAGAIKSFVKGLGCLVFAIILLVIVINSCGL
ncbi:DnaJ domain-containing protein [Neobacillus dielmonensis]|uniref:DnaJ domain-containing protein n=1 Tax=Neobacillus dielmonensis TaxID=1347369 RepID=UPI0005A788D7|nr:DnaJ domain-containing protein [Neobacillus dielmonensis]